MSKARDELQTVGAVHFRAALNPTEVARVASVFGAGDRPGKRLKAGDLRDITDLINCIGPIGRIAAELIGPHARPVRALLLDKSNAVNWSLGWHQDRTIAVQQRIEVRGFGPWSIKAGQPHVQPPHEITARMVTLRVHVDRVEVDNAPLEILPGSHLLGQLDSDAIEKLQVNMKPLVCLADCGDIWAYSTAIVHASAKKERPGRRRVLQLDYSADALTGGLNWTQLLDA